jgi:hypothetical protein
MNEVFTIREGEWQVRIDGEVLSTRWNSKGAALAGMKVEMRRRGIHELSRDCWCKPEVDRYVRKLHADLKLMERAKDGEA